MFLSFFSQENNALELYIYKKGNNSILLSERQWGCLPTFWRASTISRHGIAAITWRYYMQLQYSWLADATVCGFAQTVTARLCICRAALKSCGACCPTSRPAAERWGATSQQQKRCCIERCSWWSSCTQGSPLPSPEFHGANDSLRQVATGGEDAITCLARHCNDKLDDTIPCAKKIVLYLDDDWF